MTTKSKSTLFLLGARDITPLIFAAIPFGLVFGALAQSNGLSNSAIMGMSMFVFAGASQFIAATLLGKAAIPVILFTVFIVNLRHMLYSAALMPHVKNERHWLRAVMSFWLTDESFATVSRHISQSKNTQHIPSYYLGAAITMYGSWQVSTWLGIIMGQETPDMTNWGLDIAMVVAFIGIVVPTLKNKAKWACCITAFVSAVLTHDWPHQTGLLASSLLAIAVGVLLTRRTAKEINDND